MKTKGLHGSTRTLEPETNPGPVQVQIHALYSQSGPVGSRSITVALGSV